MIKVLFCGLKYEYGKPEAGLSFEYQNFYDVLKGMLGIEAEIFAVDEVMAQFGRDGMNNQLIKIVEQTKPDLLFCFLFTDELKKETIARITKKTSTKTFNWFADDHWRLPVYSRFWAPLFTLASTTDSQALAKYARLGIKNVVKTQWAANTLIYKPVPNVNGQMLNVPDISFVGKNYGNRSKYMEALKSAGLPAQGFGGRWPAGRVSFEKMLEIFSNSKINLNFTESYFSWPNQLAKLFISKSGGGFKFNLRNPIFNFYSLMGARRRQIKGRTFEVPACGGFLMTGEADNLGDYYTEGKEVVIFKDKNDLIEKSKYYLAHETERVALAKAGYERTIKDHTYEIRFGEIFKALELDI